MATFVSDLVNKKIRHRGLYEGKEQTVTASFRLKPGTTLTTSDILQMVPAGENVRPTKIVVGIKEVSGTPTYTGSVSVGVAPILASDLVRPDGVAFPALSASATLYSAALNLGTTATNYITPAVAPTTNTKWGPFYVTLTPTGNNSVSGGEVDIFVTVEYTGEHVEAEPIYSEFNSTKYKN